MRTLLLAVVLGACSNGSGTDSAAPLTPLHETHAWFCFQWAGFAHSYSTGSHLPAEIHPAPLGMWGLETASCDIVVDGVLVCRGEVVATGPSSLRFEGLSPGGFLCRAQIQRSGERGLMADYNIINPAANELVESGIVEAAHFGQVPQ